LAHAKRPVFHEHFNSICSIDGEDCAALDERRGPKRRKKSIFLNCCSRVLKVDSRDIISRLDSIYIKKQNKSSPSSTCATIFSYRENRTLLGNGMETANAAPRFKSSRTEQPTIWKNMLRSQSQCYQRSTGMGWETKLDMPPLPNLILGIPGLLPSIPSGPPSSGIHPEQEKVPAPELSGRAAFGKSYPRLSLTKHNKAFATAKNKCGTDSKVGRVEQPGRICNGK